MKKTKVLSLIVALSLIIGLSSCHKIQYGNISSNLANQGEFAVAGNWIFFSNEVDNDYLYKMNLDGKEKVCLDKIPCNFINVVDGWVYYLQRMFTDNKYTGETYIFKIRTDGTEKKQLNSDPSNYLNVVGDKIFYSVHGTEKQGLFKMNIDGSNPVKISSDVAQYITVAGDWIYYRNVSEQLNLYKIRIDGTKRTCLNQEDSRNIVVVGDWIYYLNYMDSQSLYKIRVDGKRRTLLDTGDFSTLIVKDDWIYYLQRTVDNFYLYKIRTDGKMKTTLIHEMVNNEDVFFDNISLVGDWIYFWNYMNPYLMKMHTETGKVVNVIQEK